MNSSRSNLLVLLFILISLAFASRAQTLRVSSPGRTVQLVFQITDGVPVYSVSFKGKAVIRPSAMGIRLKEADLSRTLQLAGVDSSAVDETWVPVWGDEARVRNYYRQLTVHLRQSKADPVVIDIHFRVYDDGVGFRYGLPTQKQLSHFVVAGEQSEFQLTGDHKTYWIPGDFDTNEYLYTTSRLSEIDAGAMATKSTEIFARYVKDSSSVQTPLMMKTADGLYINLHEAALANYSALQLHVDRKTFKLSSNLVPDAVGNMAYAQTPFQTPWRTLIVSDKATDILASRMILNLNEPCAIAETSWIKPQKMIGIWWEIHVGRGSWDYTYPVNVGPNPDWKSIKPHGMHSANTANTKKYIDFAAKHGIDGVLVEGWNVGWEDWFGKWKEDVFDFVTPYPDFDVEELHRYAASKKVKLIMHHETSASVTNYERRMDEAFRFMKTNGYDAVKTGYVGHIIPRGEWHEGQWMINHFNRVAQKAAEFEIMIDSHESSRPTGMHRTYPNWLASEAARGNEFNAWSIGNPPEHETILPFTRLMGGPMDYTPGIFQIKLDKYGKKGFGPHTTLTKQLALYVTMSSPLQMAADIPENYEAHPEAFKFIKDVVVDWDDSKYIEAEPGDFVTIARKAKGKESWFIGSITDEQARVSTVPLTFLDPAKTYEATIYRDGPNAHWDKNPMVYTIERSAVNAKTVLTVPVAEGGGYAVSLVPIMGKDLKSLPRYKAPRIRNSGKYAGK